MKIVDICSFFQKIMISAVQEDKLKLIAKSIPEQQEVLTGGILREILHPESPEQDIFFHSHCAITSLLHIIRGFLIELFKSLRKSSYSLLEIFFLPYKALSNV